MCTSFGVHDNFDMDCGCLEPNKWQFNKVIVCEEHKELMDAKIRNHPDLPDPEWARL